ncbi:MAG: hypothetical protein KA100_00950 [Rickettsiales bacterium]|nr:hypothetical protein [Rickettsiales bacterium]
MSRTPASFAKQEIIKTFTDLGHTAGFSFEVHFLDQLINSEMKAEFHLLNNSEFTFSLLNLGSGISRGSYSVGAEIFSSEGEKGFRERALDEGECQELQREIKNFYEMFKEAKKLEGESEQAAKKQRTDNPSGSTSPHTSQSVATSFEESKTIR